MSKVLIAFFSHTGENYGVGSISVGNTHIVATMLSSNLGADIFEIEPVNPYPYSYTDCVRQAREEIKSKARPKLQFVLDISSYDTVLLGYPVWCDDMPMPVYTFVEANNWNGRTVIPFVTHEGSGFGSTVSKLKQAMQGADVLPGVAIYGKTAQNSRVQTEELVKKFVEKLKGVK